MSTNFPTSLDNSTTLPAESANTPLSTNHVTAHQNIQDALEAVEAKIGVDSSAVTSSLDYKVTNTSSSNPGHKHTLANGATDVTATASELNKLAGTPVGLTSTEIGYLDGVTSAIQTQLDLKALDSAVVHDTGNETIDGIKTFSSDPLIPDEAYGVGWNGVLEPPTKNALYDKIETFPNYDKITNTSAVDVSYLTYTVILSSNTADQINNGFTYSNVDVDATSGGAGYLNLRATGGLDAVVYDLLPGTGSGTVRTFADIGASAISIKFRVKLNTTLASGEIFGFGLVATGGAADLSITQTSINKSIRFVYAENSGNKLYAVNANGTTNTNTNITGALTLTNWLTLEMVITSTSILYYANGTLVATHTTNIPTSSNILFGFGINEGGSNISTSLAPTVITLPTS